MKIVVILTCYNRKEKTENCIRTLVSGNPNCEFVFVVVDDNSSDGTQEVISKMKDKFDIHLLRSSGNLFYSAGMRVGMQYVMDSIKQIYDHILLVNDDVTFFEQCVEKMAEQSAQQDNAVIVGATHDGNGMLSYSAIKYTKGIRYEKLNIDEWQTEADTFNGNCVLIPRTIFLQVGVMDRHYSHSLGDFDYGLLIKKNGHKVYVFKKYVGICENNSAKGTWMDTSLSRRLRLKKKEDIKGAPFRPWFYFLKKNFGLVVAIKGGLTPYIRIFIKK